MKHQGALVVRRFSYLSGDNEKIGNTPTRAINWNLRVETRFIFMPFHGEM